MTETVFEIGAEGGSLTIERKRSRTGEKFIYHHNEIDLTDEGLGINKKAEYKTFDEPFQLINSKYPWFRLHLSTVHEDFRSYVLDELIKALNNQGMTPGELKYSQKDLEEKLGTKLNFGNMPIKSGFQNIIIEFYNGTTTEYEYANHSGEYYSDSVRSDDLKVYKKTENLDWKIIKCKGTIQISGSTVIINNEHNQPTHIFNSEKAFVTTEPILSNSKGWFYTNI